MKGYNSGTAGPSSRGRWFPFRPALHFPLFGFALVLGLALGARNAKADQCSDYTVNNRECSVTEEAGFCFTNAMTSYSECLDGAGFLMTIVCTAAYEIDFYGCGLLSPFKGVF